MLHVLLLGLGAASVSACDEPPLEYRRNALDVGAESDMRSNEPPVAQDDDVTVEEDASVVLDPLANDRDPDGDPLTLYIADTATQGTVTREGDTFRYEPRPNFHGTDSFTYGVLDGFGGDAVATVTVTVTPVNDAPQFINPTPPQFATLSVVSGEALEFPLAGADVDEDALTFGYEPFESASTDPPEVTDSVFRWTPSRDDVGTIPLTIWVDDGSERVERQLTIDVAPPADQLCGQYRCDGDDVCFDETCFDACTIAADCDGDVTCFDGRCAATACEARRCPDGESCREGGCYRLCEDDGQCAPGERCFGDRCAQESCESVVCATGETCVGGACRAACESSADCGELGCFAGGCAVDVCDGVLCPSGQRCANGTCAPGCDGGDCAEQEPTFEAGGCGCATTSTLEPAWLLIFLALAAARIRTSRVARGAGTAPASHPERRAR